eukprot:scaffold31199_cov87-Isochrysis_galbana.AAC.2
MFTSGEGHGARCSCRGAGRGGGDMEAIHVGARGVTRTCGSSPRMRVSRPATRDVAMYAAVRKLKTRPVWIEREWGWRGGEKQ